MASAHEHTQTFHRSGATRTPTGAVYLHKADPPAWLLSDFGRDLGGEEESGMCRKSYVALIMLLPLDDDMKTEKKALFWYSSGC